MKTIAAIIALSLATAFTVPAFAQTISPATSKAECEKDSSMRWDDNSKTCLKK